MGNRAVIRTEKNDIGIYLHWHGGRDSVEAFLAYCKMKRFRTPENDNYGWAYLCQVMCNFFNGTGLSVGIDKVDCLDCDNGDNGVYIIKNWEIIGREYMSYREQSEYNLRDLMIKIDNAQPEFCQVGEEKIDLFLSKYKQSNQK